MAGEYLLMNGRNAAGQSVDIKMAIVDLGNGVFGMAQGSLDANGNPVTSSDGSLAVRTTAEIDYPKRASIAPTVGGVSTSERTLTAATNNAVIGARIALNALDLVSAGGAILNRYPDVKALEVGDTLEFESDVAMTAIYITGLSTAANVGGDVIAIGETDQALIRAEVILFEFSPTDLVKTVSISLGTAYTSGTSLTPPLKAVVKVEGFSHA